jgi:hypothetical protein
VSAGHPHDHDLRYFTGDAQPEVFAAQADLTFREPASQEAVEAVLRTFLDRLSTTAAAAGCVLVGHIKGVVGAGDEELEFSLTTLAGVPRFAGTLPHHTGSAILTLNVIVFGVGEPALAGAVRGAWPEDGAGVVWRPRRQEADREAGCHADET